MKKILVGIDGSERCKHALAWAAAQAEREHASITLLTVIDPATMRQAGADEAVARQAAESLLADAQAALAQHHPSLPHATQVECGRIVDRLVEATQGHDMVVVGSHHGSTVGETVGGATGLRISVSTTVPTVVVPADWHDDADAQGVVVGVGPDQVSEKAIAFGAQQALLEGQPLRLVSVWGLPALLSRPAEAMGGGLAPVGEEFQAKLNEHATILRTECPGLAVTGTAIEAASPARGLLDACKGKRLLVLGTHSRTALGRTLFGSVSHGVLLNLRIPTVIVPQ